MKKLFYVAIGLMMAVSCNKVNPGNGFIYENYKNIFVSKMGDIPNTQEWDFYNENYNEIMSLKTKAAGDEVSVKSIKQPPLMDFKKWQTYLKSGADNRGVGTTDFSLISGGDFKIYAVWYAGWYPAYKKYNFEFGIDVNGVEHKLFGGLNIDKEPSSKESDYTKNPGFGADVYIPYGEPFHFYAKYILDGKEHILTSEGNATMLYTNAYLFKEIMVIGFEDTDKATWDTGNKPDFNDVVLYIEGNPYLPIVSAKRFMCEDCGNAGDFDFNDLVFDVQKLAKKKLGVTVRAAGGTMPIRFKVAGKEIGEVHELLGVQVNNIVNTGYNNVPTYFTTVDTKNDINLATFNDVEVTVGEGKDCIFYTFPEKGSVPYIIATPIETKWMREQKSIRDGYPKFFTDNWYLEFDPKVVF